MSLRHVPGSPQPRPGIRFDYGGVPVDATVGQRLLDALLAAGIDHRHICGGNGFCTSCRVEVLGDQTTMSAVTELERERLGHEAGRLRLACQAAILGPAAVRVPPPRTAGFAPDGD